jgi:hypothetical protein
VNDKEAFTRLVVALEPWLHQLVFVGGWAHRLYRLHPSADNPHYQPLLTKDADVAFANRERLEGSIKARLEEAGFKEELMGRHKPPVSQYILGEEGGGFYAEFLTPLVGPAQDKQGNDLLTVEKAEITAQRLKYFEGFLTSPWTVALNAEWGADRRLELQIPNPASFIAQKLLIYDLRRRDKQPQDLLYIHDTLQLFGAELDQLGQLWRQDVSPVLPKKWLRKLQQAREIYFGEVNDLVRDASVIPQDRRLDPQTVQEFCAEALHVVFD